MAAHRTKNRSASASSANGNSDHDDPLAKLLREYTDGAYTVRLRRHEKGRPRPAYLGSIDFGPTFMEDVRQQYGGGDFIAQIVDGANEYQSQFAFSIAGAPKFPREEIEVASSSGSSELAEIRKQLADLTAKLEHGSKTDDGLAIGIKIAELVTKAAAPAAQAGAMPIETMMTMMRQERTEGIELGKLMAGGAGEGIGAVIAQVFPPLLATMREANDNKRRELVARGIPAPSPSPVSNPSPGAIVYPEGFGWLAEVRPQIGRLVQLAQADKDPDLYARLLLDHVDESGKSRIALSAADPRFVDIVTGAFSEMQPYAEWWKEFVEAIQAELAPDSEEELAGAES